MRESNPGTSDVVVSGKKKIEEKNFRGKFSFAQVSYQYPVELLNAIICMIFIVAYSRLIDDDASVNKCLMTLIDRSKV